MEPTIFLPIGFVLVAAILLSPNKLAWSFYLFVVSLLFGGSAIMNLPLLGGASILFSHFALGVLLVAGLNAAPGRALGESAMIHVCGIALALYALVIAYFGPRLFGGVMVIGLRDDVPAELKPIASNITQAAYFCGTIILAWLLTALFRSRLTFGHLRSVVLVVGSVHAICAIIDFAAGMAHVDGLFDWARNASYMMLDQNIGAIHRAQGLMPEPSSYASLALPLFAFCAELWVQKRDRIGGWVALALATGIMLSLSSAGLIGLALYVLVLVFRLAAASGTPGVFMRLLVVLGSVAMGVFFAIVLVISLPEALGSFVDALNLMTVGKAGGDSADERSVWAMQGFELFQSSMGFGVGAGSFRSSSVVTAMIGAFGVAGAILAPLYIAPVLQAMGRRSPQAASYRVTAWAAMWALLPLLMVGVSPDLSFAFALFAGYAMSRKRFSYEAKSSIPQGVAAE